MITWGLARVAQALGASWDRRMGRIDGVCTDSRNLTPGSLFVPLCGARFDGHDYVAKALKQGAAAALWEKGRPGAPQGAPLLLVDDTLLAYHRLAAAYRASLPVRLVAVTGSNGKTSVKDMLGSILGQMGKTQRTSGNRNNLVGVPETLLALDQDTRYAVVELGMSAPGEIDCLARMARPEVGIIVNVQRAHLEQLGSLAAIADAKWELTAHVQRALVLPADCKPLAGRDTGGLKVVRFGKGGDMELLHSMQRETELRFTVSDSRFPELVLPALGRHQAVNALAALCAAQLLGADETAIANGLRQARLTGGRCQAERLGGRILVDDSYKSNPASLAAAIDTLEALPGPRLLILGDMLDMGEEAEALHRAAGRALNSCCINALYTYGTAARWLAQEAARRLPPGRVRHFASLDQLAQAALVWERGSVLVKASHALSFERIAQALREGWA